jgi:hypothetical protein
MQPTVLGVLAFLCDVLAVGTIALLLTRWAVVASHRPGTHGGGRLGILATILCLLSWSVVLAVKWPAVMTSDSLDQWGQIHRGVFWDHHPLPHTLWEWLVTRLWDSPAAIAVAQFLWLAAMVGWLVSELAEWGVSAWALVCLALAYALSPVNTAYSVTLWKDIPYGAAMLGLVVALLRVLRTRGRCLRRWTFLASFVGLAVDRDFPAQRPTSHARGPDHASLRCAGGGTRLAPPAIGATLVMYLVLVLAIPRLLGVRRGGSDLIIQIELHQIGAWWGAERFRRAAVNVRAWRVSCLWRNGRRATIASAPTASTTMRGCIARWPFPEQSPVPSLWRLAVLRAPGVVLRHQLCVASMIWRVNPDPSGWLYSYQRNTVSNDLGISTRNALPGLEKLIGGYWESSARRDLSPIFWRPAFFLYLTLWGVAVFALRRRAPALLMLAVPSVVQSAVVFLGNVAQDARYQYPVYLIGLFAPALILVPRRGEEDEPTSSDAGRNVPNGGSMRNS